MSDLLKDLKKIAGVSCDILSESRYLEEGESMPSECLMLNLILSGSFDACVSKGAHMFAAPSKHYKTLLVMKAVRAFQKKNPDGVVIFLDAEFGAPKKYFTSNNINMDRILHIPCPTIEIAREKSVQLLEGFASKLEKGEGKQKVMFMFDSIGNVASMKELNDVKDGKNIADMTRAKVIKSFFRLVVPYLNMCDVPMYVVNHVYQEMSMYGGTEVSGGTGAKYSPNTVITMTRAQEKEGKEVIGYKFTMKTYKSRILKENRTFPIIVTYDGGLDKYSGLFDLARDVGIIDMPKNGWYLVNYTPVKETGEVRQSETNFRRAEKEYSETFWADVFENTEFKKKVYEHCHI